MDNIIAFSSPRMPILPILGGAFAARAAADDARAVDENLQIAAQKRKRLFERGPYLAAIPEIGLHAVAQEAARAEILRDGEYPG